MGKRVSAVHSLAPLISKGQFGWNIVCKRTNITSAGTFLVATGVTYDDEDQPNGDTLHVISDAAGDTMTAYVVGINNSNERDWELITMNGAATVDGTKTWKYIEDVYMDSTVVGQIDIQEASANHVLYTRDFVTLDNLSYEMPHIFTDYRRGAYLTYLNFGYVLAGTAAGNAYAEVRVCPEQAACMDPAAYGYYTIAAAHISDGSSSCAQIFPQPIYIPPAAYLYVQVFGEGGDDEDIFVHLQAHEDY